MKPIAKPQLEAMCKDALNDLARSRPVRVVKLGRTPVGNANWTVRQVDPRLALEDVKMSHEVIRDLQRKYRMVV